MKDTDTTDQAAAEARVLARYFVKQEPPQRVIASYRRMAAAHPLQSADAKLLALLVRHPWLIGCIDGGLVILKPDSEVRRRLFTMLAILESSPEYTDYFLPRQQKPYYILFVGWAGLRGIAKALAGIVILTVRRAQ
jgi:hypothetical protein